MTDQQPHPPYIEDGWLVEPCEPDYAPGISQAIPGSWSKPLVDLTELDGYDELTAAAKQRGKEQGWDLAIDYAWDDSSIYEADAKRAKAANPYRANLEGDDE